MKLPNWMIRARDHAIALGLRLFSDRFDGAFSIFLGKPRPRDHGPAEREYVTRDGRHIPVFSGYRYSIKAGWRTSGGLDHLAQLHALGRLEADEIRFLEHAIGRRTITVPPEEAMAVVRRAVERNAGLFLSGSRSEAGLPEFRPDEGRLRNTLRIFRRRHGAMFEQLAAAGVYRAPAGASVLEVGYTSGGHSIFAFEQLGFRAFGIDNYYGGLIGARTLHGHLRDVLNSAATFEIGDVTRKTAFPAESMDVVFSASVLEHIQDLEGAFAEMYRLLKPGGAIIHNYSPYFCHDGGHALGIGDSPWVHVRLGEEEYLRYLKELRPHEYAIASEWIRGALHRDMPQWRVQRLAVAAGFRIGLWMAKPSPRRWLADLTPEIMKECFAATPEIGIEDLVSRSVSFVGIKL